MSLEVTHTGAATAAATAIEMQPSKAASVAVSRALLPEPGEASLDGTQDALAMLYTLLGRQQTLSMAVGQASVQTAQRAQNEQIAQERKAEIQQLAAEAAASGFWGELLSVCETVAKVAGLVVTLAAGAVASIFTGGATAIAAVAVAAVLVSGGMVVSATHCLGKASDWVGMGMEVVAAILTFGASSGAVATGATAQATQAVGSAAMYVQGGATILSGASSLAVGHFQSTAENEAADVQQALDTIDTQTRLVDAIVAGLETTQKSSSNALSLIAGAAKSYGQTMTLAASGRA
jgi:hypothetical protein